jgi:hypothetical protein
LDLYDVNGVVIMSDDNWPDSQETLIQSTGLAPTNDAEAAIIKSLAPAATPRWYAGKITVRASRWWKSSICNNRRGSGHESISSPGTVQFLPAHTLDCLLVCCWGFLELPLRLALVFTRRIQESNHRVVPTGFELRYRACICIAAHGRQSARSQHFLAGKIVKIRPLPKSRNVKLGTRVFADSIPVARDPDGECFRS